MNVKLPLRMKNEEIPRAKTEAPRRRKSVSPMVAEYCDALGKQPNRAKTLPPVTSMLVGIIKDRSISARDYKRHLREKYL